MSTPEIQPPDSAQYQYQTPKEAIDAYVDLGAEPLFTGPPLPMLTAMAEAVDRRAFPKPEPHLHAGWIWLEATAKGIGERSWDADTIDYGVGSVLSHFASARLKAGDKTANAYAGLSEAAAFMELSFVTNDIEAVHRSRKPSFTHAVDATALLLENYRRFKNPRDIALLQAASVIMATNFERVDASDAAVSVGPSRALRASNGREPWSLLYRDLPSRTSFPMRVSTTSAARFLSLDPTELRHEAYAAPHPFGLAQAGWDTCYTPLKAPRAGDYMAKTGRLVAASIRNSLFDIQTTPAVPENLSSVGRYLSVEPHVHPSKFDEDTMGAPQRELEERHKSGALSVFERYVLASLRVEQGMRQAHLSRRDIAIKSLGEAGSLFKNVAREYAEQGETGLAADATLLGISARLNKQMLGRPHETSFPWCVEELATLGDTVIEAYEELEDHESQAAIDLQRPMQCITILLAILQNAAGSAVAGLSTIRQRGVATEFKKGWDISLWPYTSEGFKSDYYAKVRVAPEDNPASIHENVVTLTHDAVDTTALDNLRSLLAIARGEAIDDRAQRRLETLTYTLLDTTETADI